jgi:hypothetical protein
MRTSSALAASVGSFATSAVATASWSRLSAWANSPIWSSASPSSGEEREPARIERLQQRSRPLEQVGGSGHVASLERAAPRRRELGRGTVADRTRVVVDRSQLEQVAEGLLEVVAEDLLVLGLPLPVTVDLLGPVREPLVQVGARPLEHTVVRSVADQDVLETKVVR